MLFSELGNVVQQCVSEGYFCSKSIKSRNDIKYQLVQSDKCKWITDELFGYDITKENVSDYLKLEYIDGDMKINLDWPFYGGYKPESIKGLDYLFTKGDGKIEISRMGGDFGVALGYGRNADGTFPSAARTWR